MNDVTLAVLAGGKGTRMGAPKSGLVIEGKPVLEYLLDRFAWRGPTMLVTGIGNERPAGCERFDIEVTDAVANQGPIRGVLTALERAPTELMALVTVDMPAIDSEMVEHLIEYVIVNPRANGAMYERDMDGVRQIEPFPCVLRARLEDTVRRYIESGRRSVNGLVDEEVDLIAPLAGWEEGVWRNLNWPGDL